MKVPKGIIELYVAILRDGWTMETHVNYFPLAGHGRLLRVPAIKIRHPEKAKITQWIPIDQENFFYNPGKRKW